MEKELQADFEGKREGSGKSEVSPSVNADGIPGAQLRLRQNRAGLLALGGIFGATLVSSCCVVPLLLVSLGVSGAWIGNLTALAPYKPYFLAATVLLLAGGFWFVYFKPRNACALSSYCERPDSDGITRASLWIGMVLAGLAATIDSWAPLFY